MFTKRFLKRKANFQVFVAQLSFFTLHRRYNSSIP